MTGSAIAAPGEHIQIGNSGELIPDIDLGMEYRTNVYRKEVDPIAGANLRVAPGLEIASKTEENEVALSGRWELHKFFYLAEDADSDLEQSERVSSLDRFNDFQINARLDVLKQQSVGFRLGSKTALKNNSTDASYSEAPFTTQFREALEGALRVSPGPALKLFLGGHYSYDDYLLPTQPTGNADRGFNTRQAYGPTLNTRWEFLPRTAFVLNGEYTMNRWDENSVDATVDGDPGALGDTLAVPNSDQTKVTVGIDGRFTENLTLTLRGGYGVSIYDGAATGALNDVGGDVDANVGGGDGVLLDVVSTYQFGEGTYFSLGYRKDFVDAFFSNYTAYNMGNAMVRGKYGNLRPQTRFVVRQESYVGEIERNDVVLRWEGDLAYDIQSYASVGVGAAWQQRASTDKDVEYDDVNLHLLANFAY